MANPEYVKLADRLSRGMSADLKSGFSIAGLDVKEFPEDSVAAAFVREQLRIGNFVEASAEEYELVHPESEDDDTPQVVLLPAPIHQEQDIQEHHEARRQEIWESRRELARKAKRRQRGEKDDDTSSESDENGTGGDGNDSGAQEPPESPSKPAKAQGAAKKAAPK